jgi:tripartite-type tricarboxylate transporter receptor subunit TctC
LSTQLGTSVVVENKPGAAGAIAAAAVARANPDGYTLLVVDTGFTVARHFVPSTGFDPVKDFTPVGISARSMQLVVAVHPSVAARTAPELVKLAQAKPNGLSFAHSGEGSVPYLGAAAFMQATNSPLLPVPYRSVGAAMTDVLSGQVSMLFTAVSVAAPHASAGKLRILGVIGDKRWPTLPDVPTFKESGIDISAFDNGFWHGLVAPAATPPAVVAKINAALNKALNDPDTRAKLERVDFTPVPGTPAALKSLIDSQLSRWDSILGNTSQRK